MNDQQERYIDMYAGLLWFLFGDSPMVSTKEGKHKVRKAMNEALRRYIEEATE